MTHARSRRTRAILTLASCAVVLAALALPALTGTARAAEPTGYGELTRFGETGDLSGQLDETRTKAIGVDPSDNSVYLLDEPKERTKKRRFLRLQKYTESGGVYTLKASVEFTDEAPEVEGVEPTVEGLAVDPTNKRVYLLAVDARQKSLKHASTSPAGGLLVASSLYAFSTVESGNKLEAAAGTKPGGILIGPAAAELAAQSETPGEALLQPRGITVDPATGEVIILAHENGGTEKEDNVKASSDHYVLQRITSAGALGTRYVDKTDALKQEGTVDRFPTPNSPVVVPTTGGKERVYVGYAGLAEIPYDFTSTTPAKILSNPSEGIEGGIGTVLNGGGITAAPDGTIYGANTSGIKNEEPGGENRAGVVAYSGEDASEIGWTGGAQLRASQAKCVISPLIFSLSPLVAAGSGGKLFALAPEFLLRQVEGEPIIEPVENPVGSGEFEEVEIPTFEPLSGPFFPAVVEFGPGGSGCPTASATAPVAKVNNIEVKGEEAIKPGSEVVFSSQVKQADALKVEWDFGDGSKETVSSDEFQSTLAKHKYTTEGTFTVTEKISSDDLASASQVVYKEGLLTTPTITVTRTIIVGKHPPKASFTAPGSVNVGQVASFESHSTDPNGAEGLPLKYEWNFGDGTTSTSGPSTTHSYGQAGTNTDPLKVTDNLIPPLSSSISQAITVNAATPSPPPSSPPSGGGSPPPAGGGGSAGGGTSGGTGGAGGVLSYRVSLAGTTLQVGKGGAFVLKVTCGGQSSCTGSAVLKTASAVSARAGKHKAILTLASGSFAIAGGQTKVLNLHLSSAARGLLSRSHVLRAKATILARDASGTSHTTTLLVTLHAKSH
jgi:PKD repeat protein